MKVEENVELDKESGSQSYEEFCQDLQDLQIEHAHQGDAQDCRVCFQHLVVVAQHILS